jgi:hypothetical protein
MPFKTIWEDRGVLFDLSGTVTAQEITDIQELFYGDARSDSAKYVLFDISNIEELAIEEQDITFFAARDAGASKSISFVKVALIANDQNMKSILQKYIDVSLEVNRNWTFEIFDEIIAARKWIEDNCDKEIKGS